MTRARDIANLVDSNGDIVAGALDNVPASNDASALTTGTLDGARLPSTLPAIDGSALTGIATDLVDDTTPQLGGALDAQGNNISSVNDLFLSASGYTDYKLTNYNGGFYLNNGTDRFIVDSSGNLYARTEGNATTFDMRAGSLKAAMHYNHSSNSIDHSLNASSATDSGSGIWRINYSNNFNQTRPYAMNNAHQMFHHIDGVDGSTTSYCKFKTRDGSKNPVDSSESSCAVHGSLA